MSVAIYPGVARALRERAPGLVERWLATFMRSPLRVPDILDARELLGPAEGIVDALGAAFEEPDCAPGGPPLREAEKRAAFVGGSLSVAGASAFDVLAFATSLRDTLLAEAATPEERAALGSLCDWLAAVALEGYTRSRVEGLRLRYRDGLERGTPVVMITDMLPAALLVGEPDRSVMDATVGRLMLAMVRVGARAVILDGGGLAAPIDPAVLGALAAFGGHRRLAGVHVYLSQLAREAEEPWRACFGPQTLVELVDRFDEGVRRALAATR